MEKIRFDRIAGEGADALYNLYIDDKLSGSALTIDEVITEINKGYEEEEK